MPPYAEPDKAITSSGVKESDPKTRKYVRIGNFEYDVTDFKHPGGSVINYMLTSLGADATETFKEFHMRSRKAQKMLNSLPKRIAGAREFVDKKEQELLEAFKQFRTELSREGFFKTDVKHVVMRMVELAMMFALGMYLFSVKGFMAKGLAIIVLGIFGARCGWLQHEGGHNSLTGNMWVDKRIQRAFIGFGLGSSGSMWNSMHEKHHATPQKIGYDMDLDTVPLVAFFNTAIEKNRSRTYSKIWIKLQAWTFLPVTSGCFVMLFWLFYLHPRKVLREKSIEQALWMLSSHTVRPALMAAVSGLGFWQCYGLHWVTLWIAGQYLFGHFSLSHTHTDTVADDKFKNWVEFAVHHTVDINPQNPLINWVMGYLNCQVVHHLFPNMPQYKQPEVSKRLVKFCKENGLQYTVISYWEAWKRTFKNLNEVGDHYFTMG
ncbi:fatty acid desaturase [Chloropicon primus]|uniref:Fatty acid desaturase n=1 Tax=Chloropicon primus TaxID=1764295 RepID=A0A5B8MR12_9CHLO|nr:fatty acid desaturase [Chloropicon primus]UPR02216.1 fatty acid desaturase [Chloropicon primus]|mmetsp:Transcript_1278/g.3713  ORF Transcript_1278/g.3713 Transcript_1278/m.3713 type:complete len:433 (-) Transcript_1278:101-1399(-)|eukprot:QDZ22999.1 fatty acid desaturase [Chloropicon primus]